MSLPQYTAAPSKLHKSFIVVGIIDAIREGAPSNGGFVREMPGGLWVEIGDHCAREKVGQTFRQLLFRNLPNSNKEKRQERTRDFRRAKSDGDVIKLAPVVSQQSASGRSTSLSGNKSFSSLAPPPLLSMTTADQMVAQIPPLLTQYTSRDWFSSEQDIEFKKSVESEDVSDLHTTVDAWLAGASLND